MSETGRKVKAMKELMAKWYVEAERLRDKADVSDTSLARKLNAKADQLEKCAAELREAL
jgi:hypothetical protein